MKVLIVDDDRGVLELISELFEAAGWSVVTASDGSEALKILNAITPPRLIVSDLSMQPMDGRTFIKTKNRNPRLQRIPTVVVTGEPNTENIDGVLAILEKPFRAADLIMIARSIRAPSKTENKFTN